MLKKILSKLHKQKNYNNPRPQKSNMYNPNDPMTKPLIIGCSCGNAKIAKEWDAELGTYYCCYECEKCGYYWEGPVYITAS